MARLQLEALEIISKLEKSLLQADER